MRVGILGNSDSWYAQDLVRAGMASGHTFEFFSFNDLHDQIGSVLPCELSKLDCLLVRSMPPGSLEQVIFRMDVLRSIEERGVRILNSPYALEIAIDKYLSLSKLAAEGLPVPESYVCQTVDQAMEGFEGLGGDVVIKPIFGSEGKGIARISDIDLAHRAFKLLVQAGSVIYLQRFIDHGNVDYRLLLIGNEVHAIRRSNPDDWRTNAVRGANCSSWIPSEEAIGLAQAAVTTVGAEFAGVDIAFEREAPFILEVNAVPGWRAVAQVNETDIAARLLDYVAAKFESTDQALSSDIRM